MAARMYGSPAVQYTVPTTTQYTAPVAMAAAPAVAYVPTTSVVRTAVAATTRTAASTNAAPPQTFAAPAAKFVSPHLAKACPRIEDIDDRVQMTTFLKRACASKSNPEYNELYRFLMSVFQRSDRDYDGLVGPEDFDIMVEMAGAIPRKFAFAPTSMESFATTEERTAFRTDLFNRIDVDGSKTITFDEWLTYCYEHIKQMTATIDEKSVDLGFKDPQGFLNFCISSARDRRSPEYKELYDMLFTVFVDADVDMDGKVTADEFDRMIEAAADFPRKFGYAPPADQTYRSVAERKAARGQMFKAMDTDNSNTISFDEWLAFTYKHICEKVQPYDRTLTGVPPTFVRGEAGKCPYGFGR